MKHANTNALARLLGLAAATLCLAAPVQARIEGLQGTQFNLAARQSFIATGDGAWQYMWGYGDDSPGSVSYGDMQYPGPTLIVNQGDTVTITLKNELPAPVSMVFPGQTGVTSPGCAANAGAAAGAGYQGAMACEARAADAAGAAQDTVTYSFVANLPGTYMYHSGTNPALQVEMGLVGTLIVRPAGVADPLGQAYQHGDTAFDREYLFFLTEIDSNIHNQVANGILNPDLSQRLSNYFFVNGRSSPDTMLDNYVPWLYNQPYSALARFHPAEKVLMRVVAAGQELHPFHHHGNNAWTIARDGRVLSSTAGQSGAPDLAFSDFTVRTIPGETIDALYTWTGKGLGWDFYGHGAADPLEPDECEGVPAGPPPAVLPAGCDHGKQFAGHADPNLPVNMPNQLDLTYGTHFSGSPYLGHFGILPPGQTPQNLTAGYFHMWHSHQEKELTNDGTYPGGMLTMGVVEHPSVVIEADNP